MTLDTTFETILRCEVGSGVHGLGVAGTDDRDEMGVCIEPPEYLLGLEQFEQHVWRSQPEGVRSGPGDLDLVIYGLRKFCKLALKGNPSILLMFNAPDDKFTTLTDLGRELRALAPAFASQRAGLAFLRYMQRQRERMTGERGQKNVKRPELVEQYGYDTKYAGHVLRLGFQGIEYMRTGAFTIPMPDDQRDLIRAVRLGGISERRMLIHARGLEAELEVRLASTQQALPPEPDTKAVNDFLIAAYPSVWGSAWAGGRWW